jgi:putative FmdB family regulatory protein
MLLTVIESEVKMLAVVMGGAKRGLDEPRHCGPVLACILLFLAENCDHSPPAARSMPTYEYSCEKCGKNFETFQSMRDDPFRECPKELCRQKKWGHGKVKRLLGTGAGLIFKGSGFYITDYRSDSYKEGAKKDAPAAPAANGEKSSGVKESGGSEKASAPAKTAEAKPKKQSTK